jgi:hypothetical protein
VADLRDAVHELATIAHELMMGLAYEGDRNVIARHAGRIAELRSLADQPEPPGVMTVAVREQAIDRACSSIVAMAKILGNGSEAYAAGLVQAIRATDPRAAGALTVVQALMLPQVRDGSHVVFCEERDRWYRVERGYVEHDDPRRPRGSRPRRYTEHGHIAVVDLDAPCTLISSQEGAR